MHLCARCHQPNFTNDGQIHAIDHSVRTLYSLPEGYEIQPIVVIINIPTDYVATHPTHNRNFIKMCGDHEVKVLWWKPTSEEIE